VDLLSDIDLAVELSLKEADCDKSFALRAKRTRDAQKNGRHFHTYGRELSWAYDEVLLFLKARSKALSFHIFNDPILKTTITKVLFAEE